MNSKLFSIQVEYCSVFDGLHVVVMVSVIVMKPLFVVAFYSQLIALFTHGKCGVVYINLARSTFYFVFTLLYVWTGLHRHVSALSVGPVHI